MFLLFREIFTQKLRVHTNSTFTTATAFGNKMKIEASQDILEMCHNRYQCQRQHHHQLQHHKNNAQREDSEIKKTVSSFEKLKGKHSTPTGSDASLFSSSCD